MPDLFRPVRVSGRRAD